MFELLNYLLHMNVNNENKGHKNWLSITESLWQKSLLLKLVSAIFYQIFIFLSNDSPSKTMKKCFLFHLKISFHSRDIQIFVIFSLPFQNYKIQKGKQKWNNL